jgi:hypothetical protein
MAKMNCGNAIIGASAGVLAADAQVLAGAADLAVNIARSGATAALPHGNSVGSQKAQHVYEILRTDLAGNTEVYKYGISGGALTPGGLSARAEAQVAALNSAAQGAFNYESSLVREIAGGPGARLEALSWERWLVGQYLGLTGAKPPGNIRP